LARADHRVATDHRARIADRREASVPVRVVHVRRRVRSASGRNSITACPLPVSPPRHL
jgi:hypothetical protein